MAIAEGRGVGGRLVLIAPPQPHRAGDITKVELPGACCDACHGEQPMWCRWRLHMRRTPWSGQRRLATELTWLKRAGVNVDGEVGSSDPMHAVTDVLDRREFDEVIVSIFLLVSPGGCAWIYRTASDADRSCPSLMWSASSRVDNGGSVALLRHLRWVIRPVAGSRRTGASCSDDGAARMWQVVGASSAPWT